MCVQAYALHSEPLGGGELRHRWQVPDPVAGRGGDGGRDGVLGGVLERRCPSGHSRR